MSIRSWSLSLVVGALVSTSLAQGGRANAVPKGSKPSASAPAKKVLDPRHKFAVDTVLAAVALPQPDPSDRLRVLAEASSAITPIRPDLAKQYGSEGLRIEQDLIQRGETPPASMIESGPVDCRAVETFVQSIPQQRVATAEQSLLGAISVCKNTVPYVQRLVDSSFEQRDPAPRLTMALIERAGVKSSWSQETFAKLFDSLPGDPNTARKEAANYAAMYANDAKQMDVPVAKKAGSNLLAWLGKMEESGDRTVSLNIVTSALKDVLGAKAYDDLLASDVMLRQAAQAAGGQGEVTHEEEEGTSVLSAMDSSKVDQTEDLKGLPPSQRARDAAASGFATGTQGNRKLSSKYFDLAFNSLNEVWDQRDKIHNAQSVVQEVCDAAAQVDAIDALKRAQHLDATTAQAIGMISIARVVANKQTPEQGPQRH